MLRPLILLFVFCALFSCSNRDQDLNLQKKIKNDTSSKSGAILFAEPQIIDSTHIIIYPLILEKETYGSGFSSGESGERTNYWNLLFFNTETYQQHLLTQDKKIVIFSINAGETSSPRRHILNDGTDIYKDNILYDVVATDYDQNGLLDKRDPEYLFISDKQGNNFRQLSPENYNIESWAVVRGTTKIILQAQKDNNNDKRFDENDPVIPMMVDVSSGKLAHETFSQNDMDSLKSTLKNIWKFGRK